MKNLDDIKARLQTFAKNRDWDKFHSPKNLSMALSVEVAELVENFQWISESQSKRLSAKSLAKVEDEIADVQIYLILLADKLGVDILATVDRKINKNEKKYPVDKVKGSAKKYSEYDSE